MTTTDAPIVATRQLPIVEVLAKGGCLTTLEIGEATGIERRRVADACCRLITRGWIARRERGCFELTTTGREALAAGETITSGPRGTLTQAEPRRPQRETGRDRIWRAIRISRKVSLADIETLTGVSHANAARMVWALERAGYLAPLRPEPGTAPTSNGFRRWLLIRDSGPAAPVYRSALGVVHDRNTGEDYAVGGAP